MSATLEAHRPHVQVKELAYSAGEVVARVAHKVAEVRPHYRHGVMDMQLGRFTDIESPKRKLFQQPDRKLVGRAVISMDPGEEYDR